MIDNPWRGASALSPLLCHSPHDVADVLRNHGYEHAAVEYEVAILPKLDPAHDLVTFGPLSFVDDLGILWIEIRSGFKFHVRHYDWFEDQGWCKP